MLLRKLCTSFSSISLFAVLNVFLFKHFQVVSRLDDSKKKKLEKEFVPVSDDESDSDGRGSEQSDIESEDDSSLSEDDGKDWKTAVKEQHKQIRLAYFYY